MQRRPVARVYFACLPAQPSDLSRLIAIVTARAGVLSLVASDDSGGATVRRTIFATMQDTVPDALSELVRMVSTNAGIVTLLELIQQQWSAPSLRDGGEWTDFSNRSLYSLWSDD